MKPTIWCITKLSTDKFGIMDSPVTVYDFNCNAQTLLHCELIQTSNLLSFGPEPSSNRTSHDHTDLKL